MFRYFGSKALHYKAPFQAKGKRTAQLPPLNLQGHGEAVKSAILQRLEN